MLHRAVRREADRHGVRVTGSEVIGLVPRRALREAEIHGLTIDAFDPSHILETRLAAAGLGDL